MVPQQSSLKNSWETEIGLKNSVNSKRQLSQLENIPTASRLCIIVFYTFAMLKVRRFSVDFLSNKNEPSSLRKQRNR